MMADARHTYLTPRVDSKVFTFWRMTVS
jgi:hypothetical protein